MLLNVGVKWQRKGEKTGWFSWVQLSLYIEVSNCGIDSSMEFASTWIGKPSRGSCGMWRVSLKRLPFAACVPAELKGAHSRHRGIWDHIWAQGSEKEAQSHGGRCEGPPRAGWGLSTELRCRQRQRPGHWGHRGQVKKLLPPHSDSLRNNPFFQNGSLNSTFPIFLLCQRGSAWGNFQKGSVQEDLGRTL